MKEQSIPRRQIYVRDARLDTVDTVAELLETLQKFPESKLSWDYGEDYFEMTIFHYRDETDEEQLVRLNKEETYKLEQKTKRYQDYLKMKEEYESF